MKQTALFLLLIPLLVTMVGAPMVVSAKHGNDDDRYESRDEDDDEDNDDEDDSEDDSLEIEADIFTDTTIVKVEINDRKTTFATEADTREEVIDAILAKFDLTEAEVEAVLELEVEDRASRPQDRGKVNKFMKKDKPWNNASITPRTCVDTDSRLEIEADVFTDTTVVKIEFVNAKDEVFMTSATTSAGVVDAVTAKYTNLTKSQIEAALDFEVEDRASRASDKSVDDECRRGGNVASTSSATTEVRLAELRARIAELQTLLDRLLSALRGS
ncbi:MAG: hypothetical protein MUF19_00015 [Candidatus Pacebacteria bacterium]|jgi:uncharacterized protein (DUF433 family)|nr:hypothetical protein [Candidatus Paceibacterota bacterium]